MDLKIALEGRSQVHEFLRKHRIGLLTLVFTDIVGSTRLKQQLGDRAGIDLIQQHHELVRQLIRGFNEAEVISTAGDSFFLVFAKPSDAARFALQLQTRLHRLAEHSANPVMDRVGIHVGEVFIEETEGLEKPKDLYGMQVDLCSRLMSLAGAGQVLMTRFAFDNARQVLNGQDLDTIGSLTWINHGLYLLKGMDEPVEVCEARDTATGPPDPPTTSQKAQRISSIDNELVLGWRPGIEQRVPGTEWVLEEKLGEGGFGEVWLGRHTTLKTERVFKFCFRADRVRALKREVTLFRILNERVGAHPNIVRVEDVYFNEPPYYLVMEYAHGKELGAWIESQGGIEAVPIETRLEIVAQVADALQAAHDAGIIHRDVKPSNILISSGGRTARGRQPDRATQCTPASVTSQSVHVKLTDFGIGQIVSEEFLSGMTRAGFTQTLMSSSNPSLTGTQLYMAPELLAGRPASTRSDIYSLGVVLFQLLAGDLRRPLTTDWTNQITDPLLAADLKECFAGNPQDRFAGAAQLAARLRSLPQRRAALAERDAAQQARERAAYRRGLVTTACIAAVILVSMAVLSNTALTQARLAKTSAAHSEYMAKKEARQRKRAEEQTHLARRTAYAADMNLLQQAIQSRNLGRARELLERNRPPSGSVDLRGWECRYLSQLCRSDALFTLPPSTNSIFNLAFSAGDRFLAVGTFPAGVRVLDFNSRKEIATFQLNGPASAVAFSRRGDLLAFSDVNGRFSLFDAQKQAIVLEKTNFMARIRRMSFSPDDEWLAAYSIEGRFLVWPPKDPDKVRLLMWSRQGGIHFGAVAFSPMSALLALGAATGRVHLYDVVSSKELSSFEAAGEGISSLAFSPDGKLLATSSGYADSAVRVWNTDSWTLVQKLEGHVAWVPNVVFSPDGRWLATGSADQTIRVWDTSTWKPATALAGHSKEVWSLLFTGDSRHLISGSKNGEVFGWDALTNESQKAFTKIATDMRLVTLARDLSRLSGIRSDSRMRPAVVRQLSDGDTAFHTLTDLGTPLRPLMLSDDGNFVANQLLFGEVRVWDLAANRLAISCGSGNEPANAMGFLGHNLVLIRATNRVELWNVVTTNREAAWLLSTNITTRTGLRHQYVAALDRDAVVHLFDALTGKELGRVSSKAIDRHDSMDVSRDGRLLAIGSESGIAAVFDFQKGELLAILKGHLLGIHSVAFSPDGRRLATGSGTREAVKLWDMESFQELATLEGEGSLFQPVVFSQDGESLIGVNSDGVVHIWRASRPDEFHRPEPVARAR